MKLRTHIVKLLVVILLGSLSSGSASAVGQAGGIIDAFPYSPRSTALASMFALSNGGPFAVHLNPASLALDQPASVGYSFQQLVPDFADDVDIRAFGASYQRGALGFGAAYAKLDQGTQEGTDLQGNSLGSFNAFQSSLQLGVGISILEAAGVESGDQPLELLVGASVKRIHDELGGGFGDGTASTIDFGVQGRIGRLLGEEGQPRSYMGLKIGAVIDDLLKREIEFEDAGQSDPLQRWVRFGGAIEGELFPIDQVGHLVKFMLFYERAHSIVDGDDTEQESMGIELIAGNALSFRFGQVDDPSGDVQAPSVGVGVGLEWLGLPAGVRFDYASRPQASGLGRVHNVGVTLSRWGS
jgi:hypothetical protein